MVGSWAVSRRMVSSDSRQEGGAGLGGGEGARKRKNRLVVIYDEGSGATRGRYGLDRGEGVTGGTKALSRVSSRSNIILR